jgi:hypothetical protein
MKETRIILRDWHRAKQRWLLDADAPLASAVLMPEDALGEATGYISREYRRFAAIYVHDGILKLQVDGRILAWEQERVRVRRGTLTQHKSYAVITANRRVVAAICYESELGKAIGRHDPLFDAVDEEMSDWWLWLSMLSRSSGWLEQITSRFATGVS